MAHSFEEHWITETLRLRESMWGPLEDAAESGRARAQGGDFDTRLRTRNRLLAQRERLDATLARWRQVARLVLMLFILAAIITGGAAAAGALGNGGRPVNLALALAGLLGLNILTFLLWAASFTMQTRSTGSFLADAWLRLTQRLARGPDATLLPRALLELFARARMSRWSAGLLSHGLWTLALLSALAALAALLASRRYTFQWETTLLSPETFVMLVQGLGRLPSMLGFPLPSADIVRASSGLQVLPESAQALWSSWLLGCVLVYGLLPRIVALLLSGFMVRRRMARLSIDPSLPGIAELHDRLMPSVVSTGIDAPAPRAEAGPPSVPAHRAEPGRRQLMGLELPGDLPWPPRAALPSAVSDLGVVDTREQRHRVLDKLRHTSAERLLLCCDARQTPDRGTLALIGELSSLSGDMRVALLPESDLAARRGQWQQLLLQSGFTPEQVQGGISEGLEWLAAEPPESGAASAPIERRSPDTGRHDEAVP